MVKSKKGGPPVREYRVLQTVYTRNLENDMNTAAAQGFRLVALSGTGTNAGLMEREPGVSSGSPDRYLLLATSKVGTMEKELLAAVDRGYRVIAAAGAHKEMLVAMEKLDPSAAKPEYRLLSTTRSGTLEKEISEAGHAGYRLLPLTLCGLEKSAGMLGSYGFETAVIMEKVPDGRSFEYKLLSTKRVGTLEKELSQVESGWSVSQLVLTYDSQVAVLERATPPAN